jgi:hypothetical protein
MFRGAPRFILNSAKVHHLTNILGGRFILPSDNPTRTIKILNEQGKRWMETLGPGREYKGGLRKIEPRELSFLAFDEIAERELSLRLRLQSVLNLPLFE